MIYVQTEENLIFLDKVDIEEVCWRSIIHSSWSQLNKVHLVNIPFCNMADSLWPRGQNSFTYVGGKM